MSTTPSHVFFAKIAGFAAFNVPPTHLRPKNNNFFQKIH
jgi:hypothetical protein